VFLNFSLVDVTLALTMRKPFDALAEGLPFAKIPAGRDLSYQ
jgi:hypothetical protein